MRKSLVQVIVCLRRIQRSLSFNFSSRKLSQQEKKKKKKQDYGSSCRNCGHIIGRASLLKGPICITHRHRRKCSALSQFSTLIRSHSLQQKSSVGDSSLLCTAIIFNAQARHFNLLLPQGNSSSALLYYQATKTARSRLNTRTKNWKCTVCYFNVKN